MKVDRNSYLWQYLSAPQKDLVRLGEHLIEYAERNKGSEFEDYSFIVFPYAKAYEGFLKQIFLDVGYINEQDYNSDHFRIGKALSVNLVKRLGDRSVYKKICDDVGCELAEQMWQTWKKGRNQVFHYFPHNLKSIDLEEAEKIAGHILETMKQTVEQLSVEKVKGRLEQFT